jgi:hypothetical protein
MTAFHNSSEKVEQTGSLLGFPEYPHRKSKGKLPGSLPYPRAAIFIISGRRNAT